MKNIERRLIQLKEESSLDAQDPIEDIFFSDSTLSTVDELRERLYMLKSSESFT